MITIFIEGQPYEVEEGQNLLRIALSLRLDLPYFCWHPALHSVGACRQCAIKQFKNEEDTKGRIVMACMTPALAGMRISVKDPEARRFRAHVIEFLMVNHPHDCPVCDEGGECHLQDMTVRTGHAKREFRFLKRTHQNQDLGPFVAHEMNRCIACYRCVRFYRTYAGGRDLNVFGAHDHVYFGRQADGVLENEFSGNLVEVCPTGVFTDKSLQRHYTRKWDLQTAPSVCVHCSVGCNTIAGERYGLLRRVYNRYNPEVNGYFLCDRGRYGYEFVNSAQRLCEPRLGREEIEAPKALQLVRGWLGDRSKVIGIGSPRASLESNFALRQLVGKAQFFQGIGTLEWRLISKALETLRGPIPMASLQEVEESDAALVLGEDVTNVAPMLALALRQTSKRQPLMQAQTLKIPPWHDSALREVMQDKRGPLFIASVTETRLDSAAQAVFHGAPEELACFGFAVAHFIDPMAPMPQGLPKALLGLAARVAGDLTQAANPVVVSGTNARNLHVLDAASQVALALRRKNRPCKICLTLPECNSLGLAMMGGEDLNHAFKEVEAGHVETVLVLEGDLYRHAEAREVSDFLSKVKHVVVLDHFKHWTTERAEVVFPAQTFAESTGTLVNYEGRAQRFFEVGACVTNGNNKRKSSWRWLGELQGVSWGTEDEITAALARAMPEFSGIANLVPLASFRIAGAKIARQPHRYSGRTAMSADKSVHEPQPLNDPDSPLAFTMEGIQQGVVPPLVTRNWQPGWNSVQALNKCEKEADGYPQSFGERLIRPATEIEGSYHEASLEMFRRRTEKWLVVPLYHIFGSEVLSMMAPGVAQLAPGPYVAMNREEADSMGIHENEMVSVVLDGVAHPLAAKFLAGLLPGMVGLPVNLPDFPFVCIPEWARIERQPRTTP